MKILILLLPLCLLSCASHKKGQIKKAYSRKIQKNLNQLERERALDHYKSLRVKGSKNYTNKKNKVGMKKRKILRRGPQVNPEEQQIELEQYLNYFCMKNRKRERFRLEGSCKNFTHKLLKKCLHKFSWSEKRLRGCILRYLK